MPPVGGLFGGETGEKRRECVLVVNRLGNVKFDKAPEDRREFGEDLEVAGSNRAAEHFHEFLEMLADVRVVHDRRLEAIDQRIFEIV